MTLDQLHEQHERIFAENRFVYPVLSRRAGGISVGINLNPDKTCNFDCIYCQVNRASPAEVRLVEVDRLLRELDEMLASILSGQLFETGKFRQTPPALRQLRDIAFSGDGEPTTYTNFDDIVAACAQVRSRRGLPNLPLVLITNASLFHRPHVQRALEILQAERGQIWAKLDAGTEEYYRRVNRAATSWRQIVENIQHAAQRWPLVIQSLFMRIEGQPPPAEEISAYCELLREMIAGGARFDQIQVYTVAREPTETWVSALSDAEVDQLVERVRLETGLLVRGYYGTSP